MLTTKETITALFAILIALIWSAWDFVRDGWSKSDTAQKWAIVASSAILFGLSMWRGVAPTVWYYANLLF